MKSSSSVDVLTISLQSATRSSERRHSKKDRRRVKKQMLESHVWIKVACPHNDEVVRRRDTLILAFCNCSGYAPLNTVRMVSKVAKKLMQTTLHYAVTETDLSSLKDMVTSEIDWVSNRSLRLPECCCYEQLKLLALHRALVELEGHFEPAEGAHSGSVLSYDKLTDTYLDDNFILNNMDICTEDESD